MQWNKFYEVGSQQWKHLGLQSDHNYYDPAIKTFILLAEFFTPCEKFWELDLAEYNFEIVESTDKISSKKRFYTLLQNFFILEQAACLELDLTKLKMSYLIWFLPYFL